MMMTPLTLVIDRIFPGVGRISRATGTTIPAMKRKLSKMLTELYENGHIDILRAIRDGKVEILVVWDAYQRKSLGEIPTGKTVGLLADSMLAWIESLKVPTEASKHHVAQLRTTLGYFKKHNPKAPIADLPVILEELRNTLGVTNPPSFNHARSGALAFIRQTLKKSHPLWIAISAVEKRKVAKSDRRRPPTPQLMRSLFPNPETDHVDGIAWSMYATGMGNKEYFEDGWEVLSDRIHVFGVKRGGRDRDVPLIMQPVSPQMHRRTFENKLRARTSRITPYDLRRGYANLLEAAAIPRTRRRLYRGHETRDIGDLYEGHEVTDYLAEDAAKIRAFLGLPTAIGHTMQIVKEAGRGA